MRCGRIWRFSTMPRSGGNAGRARSSSRNTGASTPSAQECRGETTPEKRRPGADVTPPAWRGASRLPRRRAAVPELFAAVSTFEKSRARLARAGIRGLGRSNKSAYCQEPGPAGTKHVSRSDASACRAIMDSPRLPCGIVEISPSPAIAGPVTVSSGANPVFGICLSCRLGVELPC